MEIDGKAGEIRKHGIVAKGRSELLNHLKGEKLTWKQMVLAKCYDCMGYFADGRADCGIKECPLYPKRPFASKEENGGIAHGA